jgi:1-phosphofructokinase
MIITVTANPSIDRTVQLGTALVRGSVHRALSTHSEAGGKGVNVARVLTSAGQHALALFPSPGDDPFVAALKDTGIPFHAVESRSPVRTNLTLAERDGTTTKVNEPGELSDPRVLAELTGAITAAAATATWIALSGSLPHGVRPSYYCDLIEQLRLTTGARIAVDTSDAPLLALAARFPATAPDVIKPNAEELEQLAGVRGGTLESAAAQGDFQPAAAAAQALVERGVAAVLTTLGGAGAVVATEAGCWAAAAPPIAPRSTVGAGVSGLAGYLLADVAGHGPEQRLAHAVAYGSAAAALPGTRLPTPDQVDISAVAVSPVTVSPGTLSDRPARTR